MLSGLLVGQVMALSEPALSGDPRGDGPLLARVGGRSRHLQADSPCMRTALEASRHRL